MQRKSINSVKVFYPKFNRETLVKILLERLKLLELNLPLSRVVLFGSYAQGNYTAGSDIDLLIVYRGKARSDAYNIVKKILNIPRLEPHLYTEKEYKEMKETINKMSKAGIVLFSKE